MEKKQKNSVSRQKGTEFQIDDVDKQIIQFLQIDGRKSYTDISEELGITVGTVRNRVQRLMENDILKIVGVVDPFKTGTATVAMLGLRVRLSKLENVISELVKIPSIRFVAASTGSFDLFAEIITSSNEELYRIFTNELSKIDGIESNESSMILKIHKQSYDWVD
ncbi:Lrp/AsnC family transcriptional regulator [Fictibacillus sp. WQ 8-8]|uniref:Lrp/AsnC family transcriptional regulator n=1 Tax=Fictibacillus sp. WQ 8-8 TaxID=2938788 RepID=UPI002108E82A|nr:Lrp/AsnC family transcriptional regulator [Fictibacillus sp. WQ 8-8]MCQ6268371.1 Lrp/AsnC family transcriptional regulator [Fictibacillus sp. WQ 8-8]